MKKTLVFTKRNLIEMSRDPLSYIFCIAFPILMLIIMTLVNESIPKESGMTIFRIDNLSGGIIIFGQTFVMLFTAMNVAKDRSGSFLIRLFATPMKSSNFTGGYIFPMLITAAVQSMISLSAAFIISLITSDALKISGILMAIVISVPSALMFISLGLLFGTLFNEKSAPGICSIIISLGSFLGSIWFDAEATGGVMYKICKCLPFLYCTKSVRSAIKMEFSASGFAVPLVVVTASAFALLIISIFAFRTKMKADLAA